MPTTSQVEVIKTAYHGYKTDNLHGCVLTKLMKLPAWVSR